MTRTIRSWAPSVIAMVLYCSAASSAVDQGNVPGTRPRLEAYEPNILGYAWQDDDVGYIDIAVSLKYPLLRERIRDALCRDKSKEGRQDDERKCDRYRLYLGFTGEAAFYLRTRDSDPVIARTFSPKIILRFTPETDLRKFIASSEKEFEEYDSYVDFSYAHESNGQTIGDPERYLLERRRSEDPDFALDRVSRGWDYIQVAGKKSLFAPNDHRRVAAFFDLRYFPRDGLIQGEVEEYNDWENDPEGKRRSAVHGIAAAIEFETARQILPRTAAGPPVLADPRILVRYETGYDPAFTNHSLRLEIGARIFELPISIWYEDGYGSSLARYYKRTSAVGIALRMAE